MPRITGWEKTTDTQYKQEWKNQQKLIRMRLRRRTRGVGANGEKFYEAMVVHPNGMGTGRENKKVADTKKEAYNWAINWMRNNPMGGDVNAKPRRRQSGVNQGDRVQIGESPWPTVDDNSEGVVSRVKGDKVHVTFNHQIPFWINNNTVSVSGGPVKIIDKSRIRKKGRESRTFLDQDALGDSERIQKEVDIYTADVA